MLSLLLLAQYWDSRQDRHRLFRYRKQYRKIVRRIEELVLKANELGRKAQERDTVVHVSQLERALITLDLLVVAAADLRPRSEELPQMNALHKLLAQAEVELKAAEHRKNFGRLWRSEWLRDKIQHVSPVGCFFCSRPFDIKSFEQVRIKIDSEKGHVFGCAVCCGKLHKKEKVRVLFFEKDGVQHHWSEWEDFSPNPEYYKLNDQAPPPPKTGLRLIISEPDMD